MAFVYMWHQNGINPTKTIWIMLLYVICLHTKSNIVKVIKINYKIIIIIED